jgi:hypothetical protein
MPACKNCGGSNNKVVYNYTPKIYTICPTPANCADDNKCSEILDAACVQYTGNDIIKCSTEDVVIQYDSAEEAFIKIIDLLCEKLPQPISSLFADIVEETDENGFPKLSAIAVNGVAPYTYEWKLKNDKLAPHYIEGSNTQVSLRLNCLGENGFAVENVEDTEDPLFNIKVSNVYLKITDATNATAFTHYDYIYNCYLPIANEPIEQEYLGSAKMAFYDNGPYPIVNTFQFMDDVTELPTCESVKNYNCDVNMSIQYRVLRDQLLKDQNENTLNYQAGGRNIFPPYFIPLDYSIWGRDSLSTEVYAGLQHIGKIINVPKGCPACSYYFWNIPVPAYNNQTLAERYPEAQYPCGDFVFMPMLYETIEEYPPGIWGQVVYIYGDHYVWDPIDNIWSITLGNAMENIFSNWRAKRDYWLKALNEIALAQVAFILANDYCPLHLYKYAQMKPYYIN